MRLSFLQDGPRSCVFGLALIPLSLLGVSLKPCGLIVFIRQQAEAGITKLQHTADSLLATFLLMHL
jgi:hypothetical protein